MNKFFKKLMVSLLMMAIMVPTVVMAADVPKVKIEVTEKAKAVNDEIKVKLSMSNDLTANADFNVEYDSNILELVDDGLKNITGGLDTLAVDTSKPGLIKYTDLKNDGVVITFKVKSEGESDIKASVTDIFIVDRNAKATADELKTMTAKTKAGIKKETTQTTNNNNSNNNNSNNNNQNNTNNNNNNKDNNKSAETQTKPVEKKGFFGQFFDKLNNDWVLKILFIAICFIILILIILLIEYIIVSKKNKKRALEEERNSRVNEAQRINNANRVPVNRNPQQRVPSQRVPQQRTGQPVRRPLTEAERRARAERLRRSSENGQAQRPRRPLTEEERRALQARRLRREQGDQRRVARPIRRENENIDK